MKTKENQVFVSTPKHTQKRRKENTHTHGTHSGGTRPREAAVVMAVSLLYRKSSAREQTTPREHTHACTHLRRRRQIAHRPHGNRHHRRTNHSAPAQHMLPCYLEECIYICVTSAHAAKTDTQPSNPFSLHPQHAIPSAVSVYSTPFAWLVRPFLAEELAMHAVPGA